MSDAPSKVIGTIPAGATLTHFYMGWVGGELAYVARYTKPDGEAGMFVYTLSSPDERAVYNVVLPVREDSQKPEDDV